MSAPSTTPPADLGTPAGKKPRMTWMDVMRGTAIILVILWHSGAILLKYDIAVPDILLRFNEFFLPYRMPTLMFLSGMLLPASLAKPLPAYLSGKLRMIAWPFVIWNVVHFYQFQQHSTMASVQFWTTSYVWFLLYILVYYLASPFIRWIPTWILVTVPLLIAPFINTDSRRRFFFLAAFFFLGQLVTEHRGIFDRMLAHRLVWFALPVAISFGVYSAIALPARYQSVTVLLSLAGIIIGAKVSQLVAGASWTGPLRYVGRHSLVFYVTHFPLIIVVIVVFSKNLSWPPAVVIPMGFAVAIAGGTLAAWLSEVSYAKWLFSAPQRGDLAAMAKSRRRTLN